MSWKGDSAVGFKRALGSAVAGVALLAAVGGIGKAQATPSYGYAELSFTNFTLSGLFTASGNSTEPGVAVSSTSVTMTDGSNYPGAAAGGGSVSGNIKTGADVPEAFSGPGAPPPQNTFIQALSASSGTRADGLITGALAAGATSNLVAEGNLTTGPASAGSNAGSSTTLNVDFTTTGTTVTLSFNASDFLTSSVGQMGDSANAQVSASYKICSTVSPFTCVAITDNINGGTSTTVQPFALNQNVATTDPTSPQSFQSGPTDYSYSVTLAAGTYQLTLADNTTDILSTVPEPVSIAILGSGLVALGAIRRRKKV